MLAKHAEVYRIEYNTISRTKRSPGTGPRRCTWASPNYHPDISNQRNPANYLTRDTRPCQIARPLAGVVFWFICGGAAGRPRLGVSVSTARRSSG